MKFYSWKNFRCAYTIHNSDNEISKTPALLLIHPIGVGLSGNFWHRFIKAWLEKNSNSVVYNPDLLGCGASDMPSVAYKTTDWADQLEYFLETVIQKPVVIVVQGALFPVVIKLVQQLQRSHLIKGLVLSGPPAWRIMSYPAKPLQQKLLWNLLFNSPIGLGELFYRYARRRQFIESFSIKQLFGDAQQVDENWLDILTEAAKNNQSRYAVFSFLAGFWREDYTSAIANIQQPTLVIFGKQASSISREGKTEIPQTRLENYLKYLPQGQGSLITGRNVLPYESTADFVKVIQEFCTKLTQK